MLDFKYKLDEYRKGQHSVADDGRLAETVRTAPVESGLLVVASDHDGHYSLRAVKRTDGWLVLDHWFHQTGGVVPDACIAHDLTWLLRINNASVVVDRAA